MSASPPPSAGRGSITDDSRLRLAALVAVVVITLSALWSAMESHYRSCVTAAEARYPGVPVSALAQEDTGPLKLSFVRERQREVGRCGRLPF